MLPPTDAYRFKEITEQGTQAQKEIGCTDDNTECTVISGSLVAGMIIGSGIFPGIGTIIGTGVGLGISIAILAVKQAIEKNR